MNTTTTTKPNKITLKVTCNTGDSWLTTFNGNLQDALRYFFGVRFVLREDEATGHETFGTVVSVQQIN